MKVAFFKEYLFQLNWLLVVLTVLVFAGLIKLGLWQSERAIEKEHRLARIATLKQSDALALSSIVGMLGEENINDLPVTVLGEFNPQQVFLLDNQTHRGKVGYRVLQVMKTNYGALLVNLGWLQANKRRDLLPPINAPTGQHQINGHVRVVETGIVLAEQHFHQVSWPLRIQQIELDKFSQLIGQKLLPFVVYLDTTESIGFEKNWQPIVMPPEKHRAYAFQWFSLAIAWVLLMLGASVFMFKHPRKNNNKKDQDVSSKN